uniref:Discs, large (Drosophila) homolog-associated protein 3 n=1 Tax=Cyclopterus lumpus TaxID=8103 RepID=A0A8C2YX76_CYCLU
MCSLLSSRIQGLNCFPFFWPPGETRAALSRQQRPLSARTAHHAPAPVKGYHVSRSMSQHSSGGGGGGPCHCSPEDCDGPGRDYYQGHSEGHYYPPGGPVEALALERHHSHSHSHSHSGGGTFPRSHPSQHPPLQSLDSCEECVSSGHGGKMHRIPPNMIDQFEKPFHPDGFHTLQYQRSASGGAEPRSESPSRIRHLVNSVQRLFAKSHSLEAPSKREYNGEDGGGHYSGHQPRSTRRSKSRERSKSGDSRHESGRRHRSRTAGWWSSDDNLDSDSSFLVSGGRRAYPSGHESLDAAIQELTMKRPKERGGGVVGVPVPGECMACTTMALAGSEGGGHHGHQGHSLKRSTWSAMTVSQAREVYPSTRGGGYEKALVPLESKLKERTFHYLQVPSDDWGGGYGGGATDGGGEIPCRRMRSGSYIKAMGDDDSADSDSSPKASPKSTLIAQRDAFRRSISMDQRSNVTNGASGLHNCTDPYPNSRTTPKTQTRSRSYTRSLTSSQVTMWLIYTLNRQFEAVCETMFGEVESQAVEALDLPGVFRSRSHSYVRAIQAGCSQDDDCLSVFSMSGPQGSIKGGAVFPYRKGAPPPLPPRMSKSSLSVRAQSSTESTQDAYFQSGGQLASSSSPGRPKQHSNSVDLGSSDGPSGRSSRGETLSDSDADGKALTEVHSIGVQVEDDKRRARFKRSNSVTASVQADMDPEGFPGLSIAVPTQDKSLQFGCSFQRHSSEPESASQYTDCHRTVHTQGQWAYREGPRSLPDSGRASPCMRDGEFFLRLLQTEVERMEGWCQNMEREAEENELPEEILEMIRNAVGSAQMLMSQKVQQFFRLCQQSVDPSAYPQPTSQDLAGFWDLLQLNIEDVRVKFQDLQRLKDSGWRLPPEKKEDKKLPPPLPKKPAGGVSGSLRKSLDLGDRQRTEARRRLLQTKRTASFRQNSATESADSIEIYIPEAQTRL